MKPGNRVKRTDGEPFFNEATIGFVESVDEEKKTAMVCTEDTIEGPVAVVWDVVEVFEKPYMYKEHKCCQGCDVSKEYPAGFMCQIDPDRDYPVKPWGWCQLWEPREL